MQLLVGLLQRETGALRSQLALQPSRLLLAAADCVWCTVVGNALVEDIFLESGGVFTLLDLLQARHQSGCPVTQTLLCLPCAGVSWQHAGPAAGGRGGPLRKSQGTYTCTCSTCTCLYIHVYSLTSPMRGRGYSTHSVCLSVWLSVTALAGAIKINVLVGKKIKKCLLVPVCTCVCLYVCIMCVTWCCGHQNLFKNVFIQFNVCYLVLFVCLH